MKSMTSSIEETSVCSPDSTVSSLLTSCSADSNSPCPGSLIHYKDKLYSSASEALEAYIEDFNLSLTSSEVSTGKICIYQSTPKQVKLSKRRVKPNHAPDDFNQQIGLDSLASPSRRQSERDLDSISLATDELLAFPADGSLPFVQRPPKTRHQSSEWNRRSLTTPLCPCRTSSLGAGSGFGLQENSKTVAHQGPHQNSGEKKARGYRPDGSASVSSKGSSRASSFDENFHVKNYPLKNYPVKNYPRWLTSQKSDLSVSGISSIPSFPYPAWLKSYQLFSDSTKDGQNLNPRGTALEILEKRRSVNKDSSNLLEPNSRLDVRGDNQAEESCNCGSPGPCFQRDNLFSGRTKKPFREELLEVRRGLESSPEDLLSHLEANGSPSTTAILEGERSWEYAPATFKPPEPVCCEGAVPFPKAEIIQKFLEDCLNDKNKEDAFSEGHHHRPLEALKLLLFKLQAIQGSLTQNGSAEQKEEFEQLSEKAEAELKLCDSEMLPLTNSIQKALHHLSHLKSLIEEKNDQQEQTEDREAQTQAKENQVSS